MATLFTVLVTCISDEISPVIRPTSLRTSSARPLRTAVPVRSPRLGRTEQRAHQHAAKRGQIVHYAAAFRGGSSNQLAHRQIVDQRPLLCVIEMPTHVPMDGITISAGEHGGHGVERRARVPHALNLVPMWMPADGA